MSVYSLHTRFLLLFSAILVLSSCNGEKEIQSIEDDEKYSIGVILENISQLLDKGKDKGLSLVKRKQNLKSAKNEILKLENDSLKILFFSRLSLSYLNLKDSLEFRETNRYLRNIAKKNNDSLRIAESHWDLASFFKSNTLPDSSYFHYSKARSMYSGIPKKIEEGRMLYSMALIQAELKDYTGSEINLINAIELFKPSDQYIRLFNCYNLLSLITTEIREFERAVEYHNRALLNIKKLPLEKRGVYEQQSLNNIGLVYKEQGSFEKALPFFLQVIDSDSLESKNIQLYAKALGNYAYSRLKIGQLKNVERELIKTVIIQDSIEDLRGQSVSHYNLAEFYLSQKDTAQAFIYAQKSRELSEESKNNKRLLKALQLMTMIDPENATAYTQQYVTLNDSLQLAERQIRDKFTRIRFETNEVKAENVLLARQRQLLLGITIGIGFLAIAIFIIISQRVRNQKLKFQQQQQESNQEIFNLMLAQNQKLEEGKQLEQKRISEELHDGILGQMLGIRLILTGLNKKTDESSVAKRSELIKKLQSLEEELRTISHELNYVSYQKIHNFINSIQDLINTVSASSEIPCEFHYSDLMDWDLLQGEIKINLYRIVQESLQNSVKHAQATQMKVLFELHDAHFTVCIEDDGIGFEPRRGRRGIGLKNIISRVEKIQGTLNIDSEKGRGTQISIDVPYPEKPAIFQSPKELQEVL